MFQWVFFYKLNHLFWVDSMRMEIGLLEKKNVRNEKEWRLKDCGIENLLKPHNVTEFFFHFKNIIPVPISFFISQVFYSFEFSTHFCFTTGIDFFIIVISGQFGNEAILVDRENRVYGIGANLSGHLGLGDETSRTTPTEILALSENGIRGMPLIYWVTR